jgi:tRNA (guanine-N7-)-methyltransferase
MNQLKNLKTIRSFIKRFRKFTPKQQELYNEQWKIYGLDILAKEIILEKIFSQQAPLTLEIGFGMGTTLFALSKKYSNHNFIGIEVHQPGILTLLSQLKTQPANNIRIYNQDAVLILQQCIPDNSLDRVLIFFPDPWPKKRHHKRRLIQPSFIELLQKKLKQNGILHLATDWEDYATHINNVLTNNNNFTRMNLNESLIFLEDRTPSKFEQRGKKNGHNIADLLFIKKTNS